MNVEEQVREFERKWSDPPKPKNTVAPEDGTKRCRWINGSGRCKMLRRTMGVATFPFCPEHDKRNRRGW